MASSRPIVRAAQLPPSVRVIVFVAAMKFTVALMMSPAVLSVDSTVRSSAWVSVDSFSFAGSRAMTVSVPVT